MAKQTDREEDNVGQVIFSVGLTGLRLVAPAAVLTGPIGVAIGGGILIISMAAGAAMLQGGNTMELQKNNI